MKTDIHPKYEKTIIKCACGAEFETKSTVFPEIHVELCSACHPFYTGKQKFVDTAGRVDKFRARLEKAKARDQKQATKDQAKTEKHASSNAEKLAEIKSNFAKAPLDKKEISNEPLDSAKGVKADATEEAITVSQQDDSAVEAAAADELKNNQ